MLTKLAFRNVKRQASSYIIYFVTVVFTVSLMFAVNNVLFGDGMMAFAKDVNQSETVKGVLAFIIALVTLIVGFIVIYATTFLLKKRKKELGTYRLLGISRFAVLRIFILENLFIGICSFILGCLLGLGVFQIVNSVICGMMGQNFPRLTYALPAAIGMTLVQWGVIFTAAALWSGRKLLKSNISDMVKDETGKKIEHMDAEKRSAIITMSVFIIAAVVVAVVLAELFLFWMMARDAFFMHELAYLFTIPFGSIIIAAVALKVRKSPGAERVLAVIMLILIITATFGTLWVFAEMDNVFGRDKPLSFAMNVKMSYFMVALGAITVMTATFLLYIFSRSFYQKRLESGQKYKGANTFHYRQMSNTLNANAAIMATMAVLLSISIFFTDFCASARYIQLEEINEYMPYDVTGYWDETKHFDNEALIENTKRAQPGSAEEAVAEAQKYTEVAFSLIYGIYFNALYDENAAWDGKYFYLIKQSDYNKLMNAQNMPECAIADDGFYLIYDRGAERTVYYGGGRTGWYYDAAYERFEAGDTIDVFGKEIKYKGLAPTYGDGAGNYFFVAVPDTLLADGEWDEYRCKTMLLMNTKGYLPPAYFQAFAQESSWGYFWSSSFRSKYMMIDEINTQYSAFMIAALFLGITFMFIAMALLSIKVMSEADRDKKRYAILNMLGASEGRQRKILFRQIMTFFLAPMLIPLFIAAPAVILCAMQSLVVLGHIPAMVYVIGAAVPLLYAGIYFCYFGATYYLSVKNTVRVLERPRIKLLAEN